MQCSKRKACLNTIEGICVLLFPNAKSQNANVKVKNAAAGTKLPRMLHLGVGKAVKSRWEGMRGRVCKNGEEEWRAGGREETGCFSRHHVPSSSKPPPCLPCLSAFFFML